MNKHLLALLCFFCLSAQISKATVITAQQSGYWFDASTWGGTIPADGDSVIIPAGFTVNTVGLDGQFFPTNIPVITIEGTLKLGDPSQQVDFIFSYPVSIIVNNGGALQDVTKVFTGGTNFHDFALEYNSKIVINSGGDFITQSPKTYIYSTSNPNNQYNENPLGFGQRSGGSISGPLMISVDGTGNITSTTSLPINLLIFSGNYTDSKVILQWATASEQNNAYFSIERSTDGTDFTQIATVTGAGNSSVAHQYSYIDYGINKIGADKLYYRLKQVDIDGHFKYYNIIAVSLTNTAASLKLWPNPAKGYFILTLPNQPAEPVLLHVYNIEGQLVYQKKIQQVRSSIDLSDKAKGTYFMQLNYPDNSRQVLTAVVQ